MPGSALAAPLLCSLTSKYPVPSTQASSSRYSIRNSQPIRWPSGIRVGHIRVVVAPHIIVLVGSNSSAGVLTGTLAGVLAGVVVMCNVYMGERKRGYGYGHGA